jgi:hypothetical protein
MKANHILLLAARVGGNQRPHSSNLLSFLLKKNPSRHEDARRSLVLQVKQEVVSWLRRVENAFCLRKMLKKWASEIALLPGITLQRQTSSDTVQLFEHRDNPTSKAFIEVFEGFIDASFTKTA